MRVLIGAPADAGHAFPALALARGLVERGHETTISTAPRWREAAEEVGVQFAPAAERIAAPGARPATGETRFADAVRETARLTEELAPNVVVSDLFEVAPALAAELAGARWATLIPQTWALYGSDRPPWSSGLAMPRTPLGRLMWRGWRRVERIPGRRSAAAYRLARSSVGLPPRAGHYPPLSEELVLVGTLPQLELDRPRPSQVEVTGPLLFELPHPDVELPPGDDPLVVVAASIGQDPRRELIRAALAGLAGEPVRVLATVNEPAAGHAWSVPPNARVVEWVSYSQVLPHAAALVTRGGHGTIARSLADGVPLVVCPAGGDMAENAWRVVHSGAGLAVPGRLLSPATLRLAVRRLLADPSPAARAREIAAWARGHNGPARAAESLERQFG
jgi:MGT family glycosyltransferase